MASLDLEKVYRDYHDKVMGYIRARINSRADAEDLCADVFEKVLTKAEEFDSEKAAVGTWIFTITRNTVIDFFRRTKPSEELDETLADGTVIDTDLIKTETLSELAGALRKMPEQLRDIVIMRYYDGLPLTEIAKKMDLSYGAVKLRHQNALDILRRELGLDTF